MSEKNSFEEIEKPLNKAIWVIILGFAFTLLTPWLLSLPSFSSYFDFSSTGEIGDTIGGITAPVIGLVGAVLLFLAIQAQVNANTLIQRQLNDQSETNQLYQFYNHLKENIDNFSHEKLKGSQAIFEFFGDLYCNEHDKSEELETDPKLSELTSTLTICKLLIEKIEISRSSEKETIRTLTEHQFKHRIMPHLKMNGIEKLQRHFCNTCNIDHGLPEKFCELISSINEKLKN